MHAKWTNKAFIRLFVVILACILLLEALVFGFFTSRERGALQEETERAISVAIANAAGYINELIRNETLIASTLRSTMWVVKYTSSAEVYEEEFDYIRKNEICSDFLFYSSPQGEVLSRAVVFPHKHEVVTTRQWISTSYYFFNAMNVPYDQTDAFLNQLGQPDEVTIISYVPPDGLHHERDKLFIMTPVMRYTGSLSTYLITQFSMPMLESRLSQLLPTYFTGWSFVNTTNGETLLGTECLDCQKKENHVRRISIDTLNCELVLHVNADIAVTEPDASYRLILVILFGLLLAVVTAYLLSTYTYLPISRLLSLLPAQEHSNNAYHDIVISIDTMMEKLQETKRENYMRQLLAGSFEANEEITACLPFRENMWVQVFIIAPQGEERLTSDTLSGLDVLLSNAAPLCYEITQTVNNAMVLTVGSAGDEGMSMFSSRLFDALHHAPCQISAGVISTGLLGVSISYQSALEKKQYFMSAVAPAYYFPIDWENQLITALRSGKSSVAEEIFRVLIRENGQRLACNEMTGSDLLKLFAMLITHLQRTVQDMSLDAALLQPLDSILRCQSTEEIFDTLIKVADQVCSAVNVRNDAGNNVGMRIVAYVNEHFTETDISVVTLQDIFGLSANTINKNIKAVTGQTFLPYLTRLRMERAKLLLADKNLKISNISKLVGYENEYSFRRTFSRYTGCKAQDFILSHAGDLAEEGDLPADDE